MPARLVLEDGSIFTGEGFGALGPNHAEAAAVTTGEVVFNTAMTGYQEALTDPSYAGQILVMTATMIGNYGVCRDDIESASPQVAGFVVRERSRIRSNQRAFAGLDEWLADAGVPAITGIDTRALVRRLRITGAMRGVLTADASIDDATLVARTRAAESMAGRNLAEVVAPSAASEWTAEDETIESWWPARQRDGQERHRVVALDCGGKRNIYRHLADRGCQVRILPFSASADAIRSERPDGLFISNGPGDPEAVEQTIATLREIAGEIPTFGICLGHQLLALAIGATTYKLKFGHRGANQPVRDLRTGRVEITSQNHGFCVDGESLAVAGGVATHVHLNDGTLAGFRHAERPILAVQFHPEASPGPHDTGHLFDEFIAMMDAARQTPQTV